MPTIKYLLGLLIVGQLLGCNGNNSESSQKTHKSQKSSLSSDDFKKLLENKDFEELYTLMSRATHNVYEQSKKVADYKQYENPKIAQVAKVLPGIPQDTLDKTYEFRVGQATEGFPVADFIIRYAIGSEEEKIALLKELQKRELSLELCYVPYPFDIYHVSTGALAPQAKPYVELLRNEKDKYKNIIEYIEKEAPNPKC